MFFLRGIYIPYTHQLVMTMIKCIYYAERFEVEQKKWAEQAKRRSSIEIKLQEKTP